MEIHLLKILLNEIMLYLDAFQISENNTLNKDIANLSNELQSRRLLLLELNKE